MATVAPRNMGHSSMKLMHKASLKALVQHQNSGTMCLPAMFRVPSNNEALNNFLSMFMTLRSTRTFRFDV